MEKSFYWVNPSNPQEYMWAYDGEWDADVEKRFEMLRVEGLVEEDWEEVDESELKKRQRESK